MSLFLLTNYPLSTSVFLSICLLFATYTAIVHVRKLHLCSVSQQSPHEVPLSQEKLVYSQSLSTVIATQLDEQIFIKYSCFRPELIFCQTEFLWWLNLGLAKVAYSNHVQTNKPLLP